MNKKYYLKPGYIFFSSEGHILETVLGSCVSVCLFDNKKKNRNYDTLYLCFS